LAEDSGAYLYMDLLRTVYKLAITLPAPVSTTLLEIIVTNLKDDSLAFLSGIWTNSTEREVCAIALRHATACLEAHRSTEQSIDFQTILPSLLVSLQSSGTPVKTAALECLSQLVSLTGQRFSSVYGFDTIYGDGSGEKIFSSWLFVLY
jgi:U3 small nucleolar RNA-associated protein 10